MTRLHLHLVSLILLISSLAPLASGHAEDRPLPGTLGEWIFLEQKANDRLSQAGKFVPATQTRQKAKYTPESGNWFELKSVWVPAEEFNAFENRNQIPTELNSQLTKNEGGLQYKRLFIHPESENFYRSITDRYPVESVFEATSTASSRTLLVRSKKNPNLVFFAKVSLDVEIGGVVRTIPKGEVARSVGTDLYLSLLARRQENRFDFMSEVSGLIPKGWERGGQIIRLVPPNVLDGSVRLIPVFSLYSLQDGQSMLEKFARESGKDPKLFAVNSIIYPFLDQWLEWAVNESVVMEPHAQNFLFAVNSNGKATGRFVHRDFGGFNINSKSPTFDPDFKGLAPIISTFESDYHQAFSEAAERQSLDTFFEGSVLFGLDRDLKRLDPKYVDGSIQNLAKQYLAHLLKEKHQVYVSPHQVESIFRKMPQYIGLARKKRATVGFENWFTTAWKRMFCSPLLKQF